jgi:hypothetical protein
MVTEVFVAAVATKHPQLRPGVDYYFVLEEGIPVLDLWPDDYTVPTPTELLDAAKAIQIDLVNSTYEAEFAAIKRQYPDAERESWPIQLSEAAALAEDPQAVTPFLDALLVARGFGETKSEPAAKVQAKNLAYSTLSASLTGKRHKLERQVLTAEMVEQVQATIW